MKDRIVVVFDLDDTLCSELEYLQSAYKEIASLLSPSDSSIYSKMLLWYSEKQDVFGNITSLFPSFTKEELLTIYHNHLPEYAPSETKSLLVALKNKGFILGLITDGRSVTQRNKLKALGIEELFDKIIISEEFGSDKTSERNFLTFHEYKASQYFYVGDNPTKDFYHPNRLGWTTICLMDKGNNIHKQDFDLNDGYNPKMKVKSLSEITQIIAADSKQ